MKHYLTLILFATSLVISCTKQVEDPCSQFTEFAQSYSINKPMKCPKFIGNSKTLTNLDLNFEVTRYFEDFHATGILKIESTKNLRQGMYQIFSFKHLHTKFDAFENHTSNKIELKYSNNFIYLLVGGKNKSILYEKNKTSESKWQNWGTNKFAYDLDSFVIEKDFKLGLSLNEDLSNSAISLNRPHSQVDLSNKFEIKNINNKSRFIEIDSSLIKFGSYSQIIIEGENNLKNISDFKLALTDICDSNWNLVLDIEDFANSYKNSNLECISKIKTMMGNITNTNEFKNAPMKLIKNQLPNIENCNKDCGVIIDQDVVAFSYIGQLQLGKLKSLSYSFKRIGNSQYIFIDKQILKPVKIDFDNLASIWIVKKNGDLDYFDPM